MKRVIRGEFGLNGGCLGDRVALLRGLISGGLGQNEVFFGLACGFDELSGGARWSGLCWVPKRYLGDGTGVLTPRTILFYSTTPHKTLPLTFLLPPFFPSFFPLTINVTLTLLYQSNYPFKKPEEPRTRQRNTYQFRIPG